MAHAGAARSRCRTGQLDATEHDAAALFTQTSERWKRRGDWDCENVNDTCTSLVSTISQDCEV